ncbi:hypothetical protein BDN70DRAFT_882754, partial [Pholiota conissans]
MGSNLHTIAQEIRIQVLSNPDAVSLARCAQICRTIYETCKNSSLLQYIIQAHLNGFERKILSTTQSHSELLSDLLRLRQSYMDPKWSRNATIIMQHLCVNLDFSQVSSLPIAGLDWSSPCCHRAAALTMLL